MDLHRIINTVYKKEADNAKNAKTNLVYQEGDDEDARDFGRYQTDGTAPRAAATDRGADETSTCDPAELRQGEHIWRQYTCGTDEQSG